MKLPQPIPSSHVVLLQHYETAIHAAYAQGTYEPIIWPYDWYGFLAVAAFLLNAHYTSQYHPSGTHSLVARVLRVYRYVCFAFFLGWSLACMQRIRSPTPHLAYAVGLVNSWSIIWLAALMILNDITAFKRIWPVRDAPPDQATLAASQESKASDMVMPELRSIAEDSSDSRKAFKYYWQTMPLRFNDRLHWLFDLTTSMRAPGWLHQNRCIPAPPAHILEALPFPHPRARPTVRSYTDRRRLLHHNLRVLVTTYLLLDVLKIVAMRDPYFWGYLDAAPLPSHPLQHFLIQYPLALRAFRALLTLSAIGAALQAIFSLNALIYVGMCSSILGFRAAPWIYSNWYGDFGWVASHGLAGWWGSWWHQIFRIGFDAPAAALCARLGWDRRSTKGKAAGLAIAFGCSGILHGAGSYTTWPDSRPFSGSFLYFGLQAVGVLFEDVAAKWLGRRHVVRMMPRPIAQALTLAWVLGWMTLTGPLLTDDFSSSGVWLFEPVPFSILRLLGFGLPGQGAWTWRGRLMWWHSDPKWWRSGIAF